MVKIGYLFNVIENNAGMLILVIFNKDDEIEYITTDFEYDPGSLISALEKLSYGDDISDIEKNLTINGYIITDNMYFHGYVKMNEEEIQSKNIQGIVKKIKDYTYFLENHMLYKTTIYNVGDGVAVTERRG